MKKIFLYSILILFNFSYVYGDLISPNIEIKPSEVVKIQLSALMKNDHPYKDSGIIQTWEFAHPNNQKMTGPLERFKNMLKTDSYSMLLNHYNHEIIEIFKSKDVVTFEVMVLDNKKKYYITFITIYKIQSNL